MLKDKNKRGPRSTSSEVGRKSIAPPVLESLREHFSAAEIEYIYSINFFLYSEKNRDDTIKYFSSGKYKKATNIGDLPLDFDEQLYEIGTLILIRGVNGQDHFAVLYEDQKAKDLKFTLKHLEKIDDLPDVEYFLGRSLIYPI